MTSDGREDSAGTAGISPDAFTQRLQVRAPLVAMELGAFLAEEFPPREKILAPIIQQRLMTLLYAWRGNAKTQVALGIAYSVASGGEVLRRRAEHRRKVLYLDGQMPASALLDRWLRSDHG